MAGKEGLGVADAKIGPHCKNAQNKKNSIIVSRGQNPGIIRDLGAEL